MPDVVKVKEWSVSSKVGKWSGSDGWVSLPLKNAPVRLWATTRHGKSRRIRRWVMVSEATTVALAPDGKSLSVGFTSYASRDVIPKWLSHVWWLADRLWRALW